MSMTVRQLREALESYDDDTPVRIAHQPSWPLAEIVARVVTRAECGEYDEDGKPDGFDSTCGACVAGVDPFHAHDVDETETDDERAERDVVWIVAGGHPYDASPYAPRVVFESY